MGWKDSFAKTKAVTDSFLQIKELCRQSEIEWHIKKVEGYAEALFSRFCPFKPGDKVKLARTPAITETKSWGWMGCRHFLVKGATATVREVDYRSQFDCFEYVLEFDDDSWLGLNGEVNKRADGDRAGFYFLEKDVEAYND